MTTYVLLQLGGHARVIAYDHAEQAQEDVEEVNAFMLRRAQKGEDVLTEGASIIEVEERGTALIDHVDASEPVARHLEANGWTREAGRWSHAQAAPAAEYTLLEAQDEQTLLEGTQGAAGALTPLLRQLYGPGACGVRVTGGRKSSNHTYAFDQFRVNDEEGNPLAPSFKALGTLGLLEDGHLTLHNVKFEIADEDDYLDVISEEDDVDQLNQQILAHPPKTGLHAALVEGLARLFSDFARIYTSDIVVGDEDPGDTIEWTRTLPPETAREMA